MAENSCNTCQHYDPILRGVKEGRHGRCAVKSIYPNLEQTGQVFPANVARAERGALAQPLVVVGSETIANCNTYRALVPVKKVSR